MLKVLATVVNLQFALFMVQVLQLPKSLTLLRFHTTDAVLPREEEFNGLNNPSNKHFFANLCQ